MFQVEGCRGKNSVGLTAWQLPAGNDRMDLCSPESPP
jgi:hypothetical protein